MSGQSCVKGLSCCCCSMQTNNEKIKDLASNDLVPQSNCSGKLPSCVIVQSNTYLKKDITYKNSAAEKKKRMKIEE